MLLPASFGSVAGSLSKLEVLKLQGNKLRKLPGAFGTHLPALRSLNVSKNSLDELPTSFGELKTLEDLQLFGNPIEDDGILQVLRAGSFQPRMQKDRQILMKKLLDGLSLHETRTSVERHVRAHPFSDSERIERERSMLRGDKAGGAKKWNAAQQRLASYFSCFDRNLDGRMSRDEFCSCLRACGTLLYEREVQTLCEMAFAVCSCEGERVVYGEFIESAICSPSEKNMARAIVACMQSRGEKNKTYGPKNSGNIDAQNVDLADQISAEKEAIRRLVAQLDEDQKFRFRDTLREVSRESGAKYGTSTDKYKAMQINARFKKELQKAAAIKVSLRQI